MLTTLAAFVLTRYASAFAGPTATDFFPLIPGTLRTFEEHGVTQAMTVDEVGKPVMVGGSLATPVYTREGGKLVNTTFYRVDASSVYIVAYDAKSPLPSPMPVLQFDGAKGKWDFQGASTPDRSTAEGIVLSGEAKLKGEQDVFGHKLPVLEAKMKASMGSGPAQEVIEQTATYAKGIGLIELVSKTRVGRKSVTTSLKLVKFEEAKSGG